MIVISAFPGVGKTHFFKDQQHFGVRVADSDSSKFPKSEFPDNYMRHIRDLAKSGETDVCLVSSHASVRAALRAHQIPFMLMFPMRECKSEYLERYRARGSDDPFIRLLDTKWDEWISELEEECRQHGGVTLGPGETLATFWNWASNASPGQLPAALLSISSVRATRRDAVGDHPKQLAFTLQSHHRQQWSLGGNVLTEDEAHAVGALHQTLCGFPPSLSLRVEGNTLFVIRRRSGDDEGTKVLEIPVERP